MLGLRKNRERGYTLMEVLVVATIVGILVTVGTVQYLEVKRRSKEKMAAQKVTQLAMYEKFYFRNFGEYANFEDLRNEGYIDEQYLYEDDDLLHYDRPAYIPEYTLDFEIDNENFGFKITAEPVLQSRHAYYPRWTPLGGIEEFRSVYVEEDGVVKWLENGRPVF